MLPRTLFSDEHDAFRASVQSFITKEIAPYHAQWEKDGVVSRDVWAKAGETGLLCCSVPAEYGGPDAGFLYSVVVMEELARAGFTGPFFHLHSEIVAPYILHYATEDAKQKWLPRMVDGSAIGAIAMSEPEAGSDLQSIRTSAREDGDDFILDGQKVFISNGQLADVIIVAAQTKPGSGAEGITLFLVDATTSGFERGRPLEKIGLKAQDTSELFFNGVRVPRSHVLGNPGDGFAQLMTELAQERLMQGIRAVAAAEAVLAWTIEYTTQRQAFGRPVSEFQNTRFQLAEVATSNAVLRNFVDRCIELHLESRLDAIDAAMCKLAATDALVENVDKCLQLFGGWGYMLEYPIARAYIDARQAKLAGGSTEIMKHLISRSLLAVSR
jgi:alkylation response protein AidB-like acyl-CoA dehydrogenase